MVSETLLAVIGPVGYFVSLQIVFCCYNLRLLCDLQFSRMVYIYHIEIFTHKKAILQGAQGECP